jgi:hypothetical protein
MLFSRPIQWYHSHADPIWPDGTFEVKILFLLFAVCSCCFVMPRQLITPGPESFQTKPKAKERWKDMLSRESVHILTWRVDGPQRRDKC